MREIKVLFERKEQIDTDELLDTSISSLKRTKNLQDIKDNELFLDGSDVFIKLNGEAQKIQKEE